MRHLRQRTWRRAAGMAMAAWCVSASVSVAEQVGVGEAAQGLPWTVLEETSRYAVVRPDCLWMPGVEANGNVGLLMSVLEGGVTSLDNDGMLQPVPAAQAMFDGNASTAFDPDEDETVDRTDTLLIDLGGSFRVNRIRMYPRLDLTHRNRFLQEYELRYTSEGDGSDLLFEGRPVPRFSFLFQPNAEPVVERHFDSITIRHLALVPAANREWEVAEIEVYGDGTVPVGEYQSTSMKAGRSRPVWGRVLLPGGEDVSDAPFTVQTRTGPTPEPMIYYLMNGDELIPIPRSRWETTEESLQGPAEPDPSWSSWETVSNGLVRSPSLNQYLQFRLRLPRGGTVVRALGFEYVYPPIVRSLTAEVSPEVVTPGAETEFTLSALVYLKTTGRHPDSGFRQVRINTDADVVAVDRVLVDDEMAAASTTYEPGSGFTVNLWQRVVQDGTFLQIVFRARVYRDATRFEMQALDRRSSEEGLVTAYQLAQEGDIDPEQTGSGLMVRFAVAPQKVRVLAPLQRTGRVMTPNGDGVNDQLELGLDMYKLLGPAPVTLAVHRLSGERVWQRAWDLGPGHHALQWDGTDEAGQRVPPGMYLYRVEVRADGTVDARTGAVGVVY